MNLVTLDFETYFDQDYSLSKMTTEEYVRDPRFKAHMIGVAPSEGDVYVTKSLVDNEPWLLAIHHDVQIAIVAHHAHFDGLILSHHYKVRPTFWFDTLSMARLVFPHEKSHSLGALAKLLGLGEKTMDYADFKGIRDLPTDLYNRVAEGCKQDVELTYAIFKKLLPLVPREELQLIDLTVRMFTEPVLSLDRERLSTYLAKTKDAKEEMLSSLGVTKKDLQSAEKFAGLLRQLGVEPPTKISSKGNTIYAFAKTDEAMKELSEDEDERISNLCAARLGEKSTIGETRAQRLLDMHSRGALPVYLNYYGAHTGRWSGGDKLNWQNFTRGSELRASICAPAGYVLCVIDLAQIECRMLNYLAGEEDVLEAFRQNRDLYSEGATRFYGRTITKLDKTERHLGKTLELGCGYGMGWAKLQITCRRGALGGPAIPLTDEESQRAISSYRSSHMNVWRLWRFADRIVSQLRYGGSVYEWGPMRVKGKQIILPNGAPMDYSTIYVEGNEYMLRGRRGPVKMYGAKLVENVVQALSRVVLSEAMLKIAKKYKIVLTVHDEVVYLAPEQEGAEALDFGLQIMKTPPAWCAGIPLDAEGSFNRRYSK